MTFKELKVLLSERLDVDGSNSNLYKAFKEGAEYIRVFAPDGMIYQLTMDADVIKVQKLAMKPEGPAFDIESITDLLNLEKNWDLDRGLTKLNTFVAK